MRYFASIVLIAALIAGSSTPALEAAQEGGAVTGVARGANLQPLGHARVQIRNTANGDLAGEAVTSETGEFAVSGLPAGNYVVEIVDATNKMLGIGAPFAVTPGATATASVTALSSGTAAVASHGFSLFGLGPVTSMAVLGAASAAAVTAVVSTRPNASPSR